MREIIIDSLEIEAQVGVPDAERAVPQRLTLNVRLIPAGWTKPLGDNIRRTVDYFQVCVAAREVAGQRPRHLIETLAEDVASELLTRFPVEEVEVEVRKYVVEGTKFTAVRVVQRR